MKTLFTMGFGTQQSVFGYSPYQMGQDAIPAVMNMAKADRDALLNTINRAAEEYKAITAWQQSNPNWQTLLGSDAAKFNDSLSFAGEFSDTALIVQTRLNAPATALGWPVNTKEWDDSRSWAATIDQAARIMQAHQPAAAARAGVAPPPAASTISPLAIGVGAAAAVGLLAVVLS